MPEEPQIAENEQLAAQEVVKDPARLKNLSLWRTIGYSVATLAAVAAFYFFSEAVSAGFAGHFEDEDQLTTLAFLSLSIVLAGLIVAIKNGDSLRKERILQQVPPDPPGSRAHTYARISRILIIGAVTVFVFGPLITLFLFFILPK